MTEHEGEPQEKKGKNLFNRSPPLSFSVSLSLCMCPSALSSSGMRLKETICWSICLLLCFLCHRLSPIDDQAWPFPCPPSLLLPTGTLGEAGVLVGGGAGGCTLSTLIHTKRENRDRQTSFLYSTYHKQLMSPEQLFSNLRLSKMSIAVPTWVQKHRDLLGFFFCFFCIADINTIPCRPLRPLGLKHRELIITWRHRPWNRWKQCCDAKGPSLQAYEDSPPTFIAREMFSSVVTTCLLAVTSHACSGVWWTLSPPLGLRG